MPSLDEITYSREACVTAVRDYYSFLTKMYLKKSYVVEPPEGGWPSITPECLRDLGKTDEVIALLRQLPYIQAPYEVEGAPECRFANWQEDCRYLSDNGTSCETLKVASEDFGYEISYDIPPHVIGLTSGGRNNPLFLLDTELGIVHWPECFFDRDSASRECVTDDPYDYADNEKEAEWRADAPAWAVADFFEVLKDEFRGLRFIPTSSRSVTDVYAQPHAFGEGRDSMLQRIYREHGWPSLQQYRKRDCLKAVSRALEEWEVVENQRYEEWNAQEERRALDEYIAAEGNDDE